jgi:hypothetical protein
LPVAPTFELLECRAVLATGVIPTFTVSNDWGSGFQAALRLDNHQATAVANWRLEFDLPANITSIWNAQIASRAGNHYVITGASWNSQLPAGGAIDFGFVAAPGGASSRPSNYVLNGQPLDGTTPPPPPPTVTVSIDDATLVEGNAGSSLANFNVKLSRASTAPVTLRYATAANTAAPGSDFQASSGTLTFAPGEMQKIVAVPVIGDNVVELDEQFYVDLSLASGATIARPRATGTIRNDDSPPASGDFQFKVTSDWGSGYNGQITVRNSSPAALDNWQLEFDYAGTISSIWDAKITSRVGNHYVVQNAGYNKLLPAGGTVAFGFTASPGNVVAGPTNFVLKNVGGANPGGPNQAPIAAADAAFTGRGQAIVVDLLANDRDPDGDALTLLSVAQASQGTVVINADKTVTYTPKAGFSGGDTFTYQLRDARGATATGSVSVTVSSNISTWPTQVFAPYVDMGLYPTYDLVAAARDHGIRHTVLSFIVADPQGKPSWAGFSEYALGTEFDSKLRAQIAGVRALGGDVIVSFGGAANRELAEVITDVNALARAYQSVIDAYGLTRIDFDIEGAAAAHRASVDRRNQAIAILQRDAAAAGRPLEVSYTLPVLPTGLTPDGVYVLQSAVRFGVNLHGANIMTMDYGDSAAPNPAGKMGDYAIQAANSLFTQLKSIYGSSKTDSQLWAMVGITPMIGLNDVVTETFDQQEAREVLAFAQAKGIGRISFWSLNRDRQNPSGQIGYVELTSSSIVQQLYEFSGIFRPFTR